MKQTAIVRCLLLSIFLFTLSACLYSEKTANDELNDALHEYSQIILEDIPSDLCLTIYYIDSSILTRAPLSAEDLMTFPCVEIIEIKSEELVEHIALLRKLDASILQPVQKESYINARLCYVFEVGESEKLLEVVVTPEFLYKINGYVVVNGIEVEDNEIFYELIMPFLTEDAHNKLGI